MRRRVGNGVQQIMADGVPRQDVAKSFSDVSVIPKLNLDVNEGEFAVLVGTSGCGKSPALRVIAGVEKVSSGSIFIAGRDVTWERPEQRDIAMVFQSCAYERRREGVICAEAGMGLERKIGRAGQARG